MFDVREFIIDMTTIMDNQIGKAYVDSVVAQAAACQSLYYGLRQIEVLSEIYKF